MSNVYLVWVKLAEKKPAANKGRLFDTQPLL